MKLKRSARMRTRRRGRWLPKQPRLGARMCLGTFFFIMTIECSQSVYPIVGRVRRSDCFQQERMGDAWDALPLVVARFGKQRAGGDE